MKTIKNFLLLCRPHQWYKNLLVFLALFFSGNLFNIDLLLASAYAFLILILVSCSNYAVNDVIDFKRDRHNSEKRKRPVACGKIRTWQALLFAFALAVLAFSFSLMINTSFFFSVILLFFLTLAYSVFLKKIFIADITTISLNFVIRAVAGALAISVFVSPWLVAGIFIFAFFLVTGKRYGEASLLGKNAEKHRKVLRHYTEHFTKTVFPALGIVLLICFFLFVLFEHTLLVWTLPLFAYLIIRYVVLAIKNPAIAASPERAFSDAPLLITSIIFIIASTLLLYIR